MYPMSIGFWQNDVDQKTLMSFGTTALGYKGILTQRTLTQKKLTSLGQRLLGFGQTKVNQKIFTKTERQWNSQRNDEVSI